MSQEALRVLGFSMRILPKIPEEDENIEFQMTFIGVVGMIDPPRKEVADSVQICRNAGIRTVMITGDHKVTALAIARELGIYQEGNTILTGDELDAMDDEALDAVVGTATVFARVSPADKLRIIQSLKRIGEVTAMTGDGVNDSPALKAADIGVAMGVTGTDVARDCLGYGSSGRQFYNDCVCDQRRASCIPQYSEGDTVFAGWKYCGNSHVVCGNYIELGSSAFGGPHFMGESGDGFLSRIGIGNRSSQQKYYEASPSEIGNSV